MRIVTIPARSFTYPYALNVGARVARATHYFVLLSAHSLPIGGEWLLRAVEQLARHKNAMGVYGPLLALSDGTLWDRLFYGLGYVSHCVRTYPHGVRFVRKPAAGVMGFTNAMIRRSLWQAYPFNEQYAGGGEDGEWAAYWFKKGYVAVKDTSFAVRHSHALGLIDWVRQLRHWMDNAQPHAFQYLPYRHDPAHRP